MIDSFYYNIFYHKIYFSKFGCSSFCFTGGCTKYIQPPDVVWNRPFKFHISAAHDEWLAASVEEGAAENAVQKASFVEACSWIVAAWNGIQKETIINSFRACGITIAADGSDDDQITCFKLPDLHDGLVHFQRARHDADVRAQDDVLELQPQLNALEDDDAHLTALIPRTSLLWMQSMTSRLALSLSYDVLLSHF